MSFCLVGSLNVKNIVIKINPFGVYENAMVSMATYHAIQKNGVVLGILMNNLAPMKICPGLVLYM